MGENIENNEVMVVEGEGPDENGHGGEDDDEEEELSIKSSDRYLLILSDGEFYETRCLLLPNLNYLVSWFIKKIHKKNKFLKYFNFQYYQKMSRIKF